MTETDFDRIGEPAGATTEGADDPHGVRQQASEVASATALEAQNVATSAKEEVSAVIGGAGTQVRRVADEATTQLKRQGDDQLNRLAGTIGDLSQELRRMGDAGGDGTAAGIVTDAATMLDRLGGRLIEGGLDGAIRDLKRYARNRPGMFLMAAAGAGFVAGRIVRNVDRSALTGSDSDRAEAMPPPTALGTGPASTSGGLPGTGAPPGTTGLVAGPTRPMPNPTPGTTPDAGIQ